MMPRRSFPEADISNVVQQFDGSGGGSADGTAVGSRNLNGGFSRSKLSALDCCYKSYSVSLVSSSDKSNPCSAANARVARMLSAAPIR
ncbi:MAG: hypothetical protein ACI84R_002789 [Candidatus Azotimanducaceae bacterium]|jgi:hypothetical protein